jgi:hypothetical protein
MSTESSNNKKIEFVEKKFFQSMENEFYFSDGTIFGIGNPLLDISAEVSVSFLEGYVNDYLTIYQYNLFEYLE